MEETRVLGRSYQKVEVEEVEVIKMVQPEVLEEVEDVDFRELHPRKIQATETQEVRLLLFQAVAVVAELVELGWILIMGLLKPPVDLELRLVFQGLQ
jgi:hypothetical protein